MAHVLIASDSSALRDEVRAAIEGPDTTIAEVTRGLDVVAAVKANPPDLVVLDLQIGKMGGMATCSELRLEAGAGRLPHLRVLMLLDRRADVFLARRSQADGWVVKPLDPMRLAAAMTAILGTRRYEDDSYVPVTVALPGS